MYKLSKAFFAVLDSFGLFFFPNPKWPSGLYVVNSREKKTSDVFKNKKKNLQLKGV
jgi:hypothetical protein